MRNQEWHSTATQLHALDTSQLVFSLLSGDAVDGETALGVVDKAEVLASLVDGDNVHETSRVCDVGANLAVNLDVALHHDALGFAVVEGILVTVADEEKQRQAVAGLVRTWPEVSVSTNWRLALSQLNSRSLWRVGTRELVEQPVRWRTQAVLMLLWTTTHVGDLLSRA